MATNTLVKPSTFPESVVFDLRSYMEDYLEGASNVLMRPVRSTDPSGSTSVTAEDWEPAPSAYETGRYEPLLNRYNLTIMAFVKHIREDEGLQLSGILARNIRRMLAGDKVLRAKLVANVEDYGTGVERVQRLHLVSQKFHSNEVKGNHLFLSIATMMIETEST